MRPTFIILFSESLKLTLWGGSAKDWEHYTGIQWNCAKQQLSQINKFRFLKNLHPQIGPTLCFEKVEGGEVGGSHNRAFPPLLALEIK